MTREEYLKMLGTLEGMINDTDRATEERIAVRQVLGLLAIMVMDEMLRGDIKVARAAKGDIQ